jgi:site-specific DNA-cytosine methylase
MSKADTPPNSQAANAVFSFSSGAGFLDLGLEKSGFEIAFANELNAESVPDYRHSNSLGATRQH